MGDIGSWLAYESRKETGQQARDNLSLLYERLQFCTTYYTMIILEAYCLQLAAIQLDSSSNSTCQ
jgi:tryptophan-rich sensory protein